MPKKLHDKYQRQARAIYPGNTPEDEKKRNNFVFGKLYEDGWRPKVKGHTR